MVLYVTKEDLGEEIVKIIRDTYVVNWESSFIPRLNFDNDTAKYDCGNCGQGEKKIHFEYNISSEAGTDKVIFDWNVDLERVYLKGYVCENCGSSKISLCENSVDNPGEVILEKDGL